ncbi:MAG: LysM and BON domain-containing protein [Pseudomonadota bacterium]
MGLFSFVKDAGASIFGGGSSGDDLKPVQAHLSDNGIDPSGLKFRFEGARLTVTGRLSSQEEKEKAIVILGNVNGVEEVDDQITVGAAAEPEPEPAPAAAPAEAPVSSATPGGDATPEDWQSDTYTVQSGDTLSGIAKKVYGNASKYMQIFEANTPMLKDPNRIYPGQVLRIPPEG